MSPPITTYRRLRAAADADESDRRSTINGLYRSSIVCVASVRRIAYTAKGDPCAQCSASRGQLEFLCTQGARDRPSPPFAHPTMFIAPLIDENGNSVHMSCRLLPHQDFERLIFERPAPAHPAAERLDPDERRKHEPQPRGRPCNALDRASAATVLHPRRRRLSQRVSDPLLLMKGSKKFDRKRNTLAPPNAQRDDATLQAVAH